MGTDAVRISTEPDRFAAVHISQGFRVGDLVYISGQAAVDDQGRVVGEGDFGAQARRAVERGTERSRGQLIRAEGA